MKTIILVTWIRILTCAATSAEKSEIIPGLNAVEKRMETRRWSLPFRRTLEHQFAGFKAKLALARKAGGIDVYYLIPDGADIGWFISARHAFNAALEQAALDPGDRHDPKLIAEMREAVEASENEMPTPAEIVFGDSGAYSEEEQEKARVIAREKWRLRKSAEDSLSIVLTSAEQVAGEAGEAANGTHVVLRVVNSATGTFYMDRRAIASGLVLRLLDAKGQEVLLNEKGRAMKEYQAIEFHLRAAPITPKYSPRFELNLTDYCDLVPGARYTVQAEWTLEVHDSVFPPDKLNESSKHRITLKAPPLALKMPVSK